MCIRDRVKVLRSSIPKSFKWKKDPTSNTVYLSGLEHELKSWDEVWKKINGQFNGACYVFVQNNSFLSWNKNFVIPEAEGDLECISAKKRKRDTFKLFAKLKF